MLARQTLFFVMLSAAIGLWMLASPQSAAAAAKKKGDQAGFKAYDLNNDLHLSPAEYKTMAETKPKKYAGPFKQVDANSDGLISIDEYRAAMKKPAKGKKSK